MIEDHFERELKPGRPEPEVADKGSEMQEHEPPASWLIFTGMRN
jgi:hypothetical protein